MLRLIAVIRDSWRRARASVVAETLLKNAGHAGTAGRTANAAVAYAWRHHPERLSGRSGARPGHEVIAVFALALASQQRALGEWATPALRDALDAAIGKRGLYRERIRAAAGTSEGELWAYARRVNAKPEATIPPPGSDDPH